MSQFSWVQWGDPNPQGVLLKEMMERSDLSPVSLGCLASGQTTPTVEVRPYGC